MCKRILLQTIVRRIESMSVVTPKTFGRFNVLGCNNHFMATAILAAKRSPDPNTQVGACLVKNEKIIGVGFNRFPRGCEEKFSWAREGSPLETKYMYVLHAEPDAILGAQREDVYDSHVFVTLFPCNECAKLIVESGIKKVIYLSDKYASTDSTIASKRMLDAASIEYEQFQINADIDKLIASL